MPAEPDTPAPQGAICLGCGAMVDEATGSGACPSCGLPLMKRGARLRLGLGDADPESRTGASSMPAEVEEAAREAANSFAGKYILVRKIGGGGMAWVWKAWEIPLARFVAIKFLKAPSGEDVLRFEREAQVAASLNHANIVPVHEFGRSRGEYYLVMKFVDGAALNVARPAGADLLKVMVPVCEAVHHAHEAGVIHRDIKPQNIMLTADGWPYVLDFGLAKQVEGGGELSVSGFVMGTPQYMAPEQAAGRRDQIGRRSDVYGLGATLYTIVTGRPPFLAENALDTLRKVLDEDVVAPRRLKPETPAPLESIILKAMEKDPERRYSTALELAEDLRRLSSGKTIVARAPRRRLAPRIVRRNPGVSAALAAAALAAVAVIAWLATRPPGPEEARNRWMVQFGNERIDLDLSKPVDEARRDRLGALMKRSREALGSKADPAEKWYADQADRGLKLVGEWETAGRAAWFGRRDEAARLRDWAGAMGSALEGLAGEFAKSREEFRTLASRSDSIARFPGLVTLQVNVSPYATIRSMRAGDRWLVRDGRVVSESLAESSDPGLLTPLALTRLEIDSYEIELVHPELGPRTCSLRKEELRHDGTYRLMGAMTAGGSLEVLPVR